MKQLVEGSSSIIVIALALHPRRRTHNLRVWSGKSINAEVKKWLTGQNRSKEDTYKYVLFSVAHRYPLLYLYICDCCIQYTCLSLIIPGLSEVRDQIRIPLPGHFSHLCEYTRRNEIPISIPANTQSIGSSNEWTSDRI